MAAVVFLKWLGIDMFWSIAIWTHKDTKKGKKEEVLAKRLSKTIEPNSYLFDNV